MSAKDVQVEKDAESFVKKAQKDNLLVRTEPGHLKSYYAYYAILRGRMEKPTATNKKFAGGDVSSSHPSDFDAHLMQMGFALHEMIHSVIGADKDPQNVRGQIVNRLIHMCRKHYADCQTQRSLN